MIVPVDSGVKGSFGECTGINLDVRYRRPFRCIHSIRASNDGGTIAANGDRFVCPNPVYPSAGESLFFP